MARIKLEEDYFGGLRKHINEANKYKDGDFYEITFDFKNVDFDEWQGESTESEGNFYDKGQVIQITNDGESFIDEDGGMDRTLDMILNYGDIKKTKQPKKW